MAIKSYAEMRKVDVTPYLEKRAKNCSMQMVQRRSTLSHV